MHAGGYLVLGRESELLVGAERVVRGAGGGDSDIILWLPEFCVTYNFTSGYIDFCGGSVFEHTDVCFNFAGFGDRRMGSDSEHDN